MTLAGYTGATSLLPGQEIDLFLSTDGSAGPQSIVVTRVAGSESATLVADVSEQPVPASSAWEGFGWSATASFTVPAAWPSGYYQAAGPAGEVVGGFVVRPSAPGSASTTLVSIDLLTNQAYNGSGGKSLYDPGRASVVSFDRPGGLPGGRELPLLGWLANEGIAVEYCAAQDLEDGDLDAYDCLIVAGHAEYWTGGMRDAVEHYVAGGGNLVSLSGNTCYRQVRLEDAGRTLVFHKYAGADPVGGRDATVAFAEPPVNRPQNALLGVGFTHASWGATQGAAAYQLHFPGHWAMANVGVTATAPFMSYETDAAALVEEPEG